MIGQTLSHYRIMEKLGGGGMGVVYRAHDERLDRDVALKVLPAGLLADETARSRFRREALTLSQLSHPNIAVVHDFDSENGVDFLTMEYLVGETLAAKVASGALAEREVIALGAQIAEALEDAHEHQIIHRDLKPSNVIVTAKGRAKVLDFGLAKLVRPMEADGETASLAETQVGAVMGTVPYMSPEQLQGKAVDARTDIYALGALLYELATGRRPFPEKQSSHLIAAILTQTPQPPRQLNGEVSPGLEAIILKALQKNPEERYQSAKEVLEDFGRLSIPGSAVGLPRQAGGRRWMPSAAAVAAVIATFAILFALNVGGLRSRLWPGAGAGSAASQPKIQSLAVLPLENLSGDPKQDYFADGMTEELTTDLAKISALKVISRTAMMRYKGTKKPLPEIAKELNVDAVIEGSVLREGDRVRITAQLINAGTQQDMWAESYERDASSVLALESEIASTVAGKVQVVLTPSEKSRLASARAVNPQAYDAYLKGMEYWYKATPKDWDTALGYFQLALKEDPNSARAYVGISHVWAGRAQMGAASPTEAVPKEKAAAEKAVELDPTLPDAHFALAGVKSWSDWDWAAAEPEYRKAIELNPDFADARAYYSHFLMMMRRPEEGMQQMKRALDLDPLNGLYRALYAVDLFWVRRNDDALAQAQMALQTAPGNPVAYAILWEVYARKGEYKDAVDAAKSNLKTYGSRELERAMDQGYTDGGYQIAMRRGAEALVALSRRSFVSPLDIANCYIEAGDKDKALDWIEKGFESRDPGMPYLGVPLYDSLRSEPRFQALVKKMNLPE
ncbi:MAG: protein kinase domain-containing protein [Deltaproteobacteria bacterium]